MTVSQLEKKARYIRQKSFLMCASAGKGHLGGAFSSAEIITTIYYSKIFNISPAKVKNKNRDRIIFSKGHACLALYCALGDLGYFPKKELDTYGANGTFLGGHPDHFIPGVEVSSGSLGHGLGIGAGIALAAKLNGQKFTTVVILGDGECMEGSIWEAVMFGVSKNLNNLVAVVDDNGVSATAMLDQISGKARLAAKWKSFGWDVYEVDGHNFKQLMATFKKIKLTKNLKPAVVVANTVKGKGVTFMENDPHWHHGVPKGEQYDLALSELGLK